MQDTNDQLGYNDFEDEEINPEEIVPPPEEEAEPETPTLASRQEEYNKTNQASYQSLYQSLFLSVYDVEKALDVSYKSFVDVLVNRGIEADPESLFNRVNTIQDRMVHIMAAKHLAHGLGLAAEWDSILEREMNLIYGDPRTRPINPSKPVNAGSKNMAQGEANDQ